MEDNHLLSKAIGGVKVVSCVIFLKVIVQSLTQIILVRVLAPQIFGQFVFVQIAIGFFELFCTIQGKKFVVRQNALTQQSTDVAFTVELILSLLAAAVLIVMSKTISVWFGSPEIAVYIRVSALSLLFNPFFLTLSAIFERKLDFLKANIPNFVDIVVYAAVSILLGFLGFGIWALVYGLIAGKISGSIALWRIFPLRPRLDLHKETLMEVVKFGLPVTLSGAVAYLYTNVDKFMVGRFLGDQELGYYWFAFTMPHLLLTIQANADIIIFPAFANAKDRAQLRRGFIKATKLSASLFLFPCAVVLVLGGPVIRFIFGEKWLPAIAAFKIFMVLVALRGIFISHWSSLYLNKGKTTVMLYISLLNLLLISLFGYFIIPQYGINGMAAVILCVVLLNIPILKYTLRDIIKYSYLKMLFPQLIIFFVAVISCFLLKGFFVHSVAYFIISLTAIVMIYIMSLRLFDRELFFWILNRFLKSAIGR